MLYVDFYKEQYVFFTVIGNRYILNDSSVGLLKDYKEAVSEMVRDIHNKDDIDFKPIDEFLETNKDKYGKNENWEETAQKVLKELMIHSYHPFIHAALSHGKRATKFAKILTDSPHKEVREQVALHGFCLKKLCKDESAFVRAAVASRGYALDTLIDDKDPLVRQAVASQGYGLEKLSKDRITEVRKEVVRQGYKLDQMIQDKSPHVRGQVAKMGYGLDILEKEDNVVVKKYIREYKKSLDRGW